MSSFPLKIVTPDGLCYDGQAEELVVRTTTGDMGGLAGHCNCVAPLGMGQAMVQIGGGKRYAAGIGGMLTVLDGQVTLVPTTFEWAGQIDAGRAEVSEQRAKSILEDRDATDAEIRLAEARLKRALVRKSVASNHK